MAKGKSKRVVAPNIKAAAGTAALLAGATAAKGLRKGRTGTGGEGVVVASVPIPNKQGVNGAPPANLGDKVIAETAPFQMIRQERSLEEAAHASLAEGEMITAKDATEAEAVGERTLGKKRKKKVYTKPKKVKSVNEVNVKSLGMEPSTVAATVAADSGMNKDEKNNKKRFRWI